MFPRQSYNLNKTKKNNKRVKMLNKKSNGS